MVPVRPVLISILPGNYLILVCVKVHCAVPVVMYCIMPL